MNKLSIRIPSILLMVLMIVSCSTPQESQQEDTSNAAPIPVLDSLIAPVITAHGGLVKWKELKSMSYAVAGRDELHQIDLVSRRTRIDAPFHVLGSDGNNVWLFPDSADVSGPRFYHNLYFYFFSIPFVLTDPGIYFERVDDRELLGKTYKGIKVSFGKGVGDSSNDNYIVYHDPETNQMEWLMYTVTFGKDSASNRYNLIKYNNPQTVSGLTLATELQWYQHEDGVVGEPRGSARVFENINLSQLALPDSIFVAPEGASLH